MTVLLTPNFLIQVKLYHIPEISNKHGHMLRPDTPAFEPDFICIFKKSNICFLFRVKVCTTSIICQILSLRKNIPYAHFSRRRFSAYPVSLKVLMLPHMEVGPTARFDPGN